jgi:hypothetical protein
MILYWQAANECRVEKLFHKIKQRLVSIVFWEKEEKIRFLDYPVILLQCLPAFINM